MGKLFPLGDLTRDQTEALQGTQGDPGDTNRYVTHSDDRLTDATQIKAGIMSTADKTKLDGVESGATANVITNTVPVDVTKAAATVGTSTELARQDHKHDIATAVAVSVGTAGAEGSSSSLSRADHVHPGLTRGANDFNQFTNKPNLLFGDYILIEDQSASGAKKYATIQAALTASGTGAITTAEYNAYSTPANPGTTYTTFHSFTTQNLPIGTYRFAWAYEYSSSSTSTSFEGQILIDNVAYQTLSVTPRQATDTLANSGFKYLTFGSAGTHTIRLDIKRTGTSTVTCYRVDFECWRINV